MLSVRRRSAAEMGTAARFTAQVFAPHDVEATCSMLRLAYESCPFMPIDQVWLMEDDGRPVLQWQMLEFAVRIGCAQVRAAGLFAVTANADEVAKHPPHSLEQLGRPIPAAEGFDIMLGFARKGQPFTQLRGAVPLGAEYFWSMAVPKERVRMRGFSRATAAHVPTLVELSNAANCGRPISLVRTAEMWPWLQRKPPEIWLGDGGYVGVRDGPGTLEVCEVAGYSAVFYEQALAALVALAQERGRARLTGSLPPDHPVVQLSLHHGADLSTRFERNAGSFAALTRPRALMEKIQPELQRRWCATHPDCALQLRVHCADGEQGDAPMFVLQLNSAAHAHAELDLHVDSGTLLQLCVGYAPPQQTLRYGRGKVQTTAGEVPDSLALAALFPQQHPFIAHTDRW